MMKITARSGLGLLVIMTALAAPAPAADDASAGPDEAAMMEAWMRAGAVGPHHEQLAKSQGTWDLTVKAWMPGQAEPEVSKATSKVVVIMGGRFVHETVRGEGPGGMPFEGAGLTGYDNLQKCYTSVWADNMTTAILTSHGHCTDDASVCTWYSEGIDPMTGGPRVSKMVERSMGPDKKVVEFYETNADGSDRRTMELTYVRSEMAVN